MAVYVDTREGGLEANGSRTMAEIQGMYNPVGILPKYGFMLSRVARVFWGQVMVLAHSLLPKHVS